MASWNFTGRISAKSVRSDGYPSFRVKIKDWHFSETIGGALHNHIDAAHLTAEIIEVGKARDGLLNLMDKGKAALSKWDEAGELSYVYYVHDATGRQRSSLFIIVGLPENALAAFSGSLDLALLNGNTVGLQCSGGFSEFADNETTSNPTYEEFELGKPMKFWEPVLLSVFAHEESR